MNELEMPLFMFTYLSKLAIQLNGFREKHRCTLSNSSDCCLFGKAFLRKMCE